MIGAVLPIDVHALFLWTRRYSNRTVRVYIFLISRPVKKIISGTVAIYGLVQHSIKSGAKNFITD